MAGSQNPLSGDHKMQGLKDWLISDALGVPTHMTAYTASGRYNQISRAVRDHDVRHIVGHSLGSAVSSQWIVDHPDWQRGKTGAGRLYNHPAVDVFGTDDPRYDSYSDSLDPISRLDFTADRGTWSHPYISVPHSYRSLT